MLGFENIFTRINIRYCSRKMEAATSFVTFAIPYVLVCGSYQRNRSNDRFCDSLGSKIARHNIGIISAGGRPGIKVGECLNKMLTDSGQYEPTKLLTVYRKKDPGDEIKVKRFGCAMFIGNTLEEMRAYLFSRSKVMIVIGGASKTKEEVVLALEAKLHVIPVAMTGGAALEVWREFHYSGKYRDEASFLKLNNSNPSIASNAVIRQLIDLALDGRTEFQ